MKRFFLQLTVANLLLLVVVTIWGHFLSATDASRTGFDSLVGIAAVFSALIHSIVYTYFIAATKFVERAVEEHGYDVPAAVDRAKANKRKAFRYGFMAIVFVMAAAFVYYWSSGAVRQDFAIWRGWAAIMSYLAILVSVYAAGKEWNYVVANSVITDDVLEKCADLRHEAAPNDSTRSR